MPNIRYNYIGFRLAASEVVGNSLSGIYSITPPEKPRSDTRYNVLGQPVSESYQGIVIQDGQKTMVH